MLHNSSLKKRISIVCASIAMLGTAAVGGLFASPVSAKAEGTASTSHTLKLSEEVAKVAYTDEEKTASGWNGTSRDENKKALFQTAFAKSNLKFYAAAGNNADETKATSWAVKEYYEWANDGNSWKWSYSSINGLSVGNNAGNEFGFNFVEGKYTVSAMSYSNSWAIAWTAPADGTFAMPASTLTIDTATNATLQMAVTKGDYLLPNEEGWTEYAESGTVNAQRISVTAGDVIYLNMYAAGTAAGRKVKIAYDPTFEFVDANDKVEEEETTAETTLLSTEVAKVSYTDEEKTASGWDGTSRDANKKALFKTAFAKSNLKFYAAAGNNADETKATSWAVKEYYEWANDGNSWKWSYSSINGLSVGNNAGNEFGFNFVEGKYNVSAMSYSNSWAIAWTAPATGTVTLPATTLTIDTATNATLQMAVTKGKYLLPNATGWTEYTESTTVAKQEFEVIEGDVIYLNMYAAGTAAGRKVKIAYDPSFVFEKETDPCKLYGHAWVDATCTTPKTCSVCQLTEGSELGHAWQNATCTAPKTCGNCQLTEGAALGHSWVNADCTSPKTCSTCQATEGKALGHDWQAATCTEAKYCKTCQITEGEALGHDWQNATCTAPKTCSVCQATEGDALGHTWVDATCTAAKTCSVCQATEGEVLAHTFGEWAEADEQNHKRVCACGEEETAAHTYGEWTVTKEATATENGSKEKACECGHKITETIPATGESSASENNSEDKGDSVSSGSGFDFGCSGAVGGLGFGAWLIGAAGLIFLKKKKD